jgi:outer membrane protein insertion porin family
LVDVTFNVEEGPSAQLGGGIGYSESQSFILNGNYADSNFMGTGERIAVELNSGRYQKVYSFSHTNPYITVHGLQRTTSLTYNDITQFVSASSDFSSETLTAGLTFSYPISEYQSIQLGTSLQDASLLTSELGSAVQAQQWVRSNGDSFERVGRDRFSGREFRFFGTEFKSAELVMGWSYDSRNRALFADRGTRHMVSLQYAVPGSDVEYYIAKYEGLRYIPLWGRWAFSLHADLAYGHELGDTTGLPPFRNFFGGGPDSVRGFRESRLGPKDQFGNPYGGNMRIVGSAELIFPMPEKWRSNARVSAFYDIGNVFYEGNGARFTDKGGFPIDYSFDTSNLKSSVGVAVQWLAPLGLFRFSFGVPLNDDKGNELLYGDETEQFQFSIGQAF